MPEFEVRPTVRRSTIVPRRLGDGANNTTALVFFFGGRRDAGGGHHNANTLIVQSPTTVFAQRSTSGQAVKRPPSRTETRIHAPSTARGTARQETAARSQDPALRALAPPPIAAACGQRAYHGGYGGRAAGAPRAARRPSRAGPQWVMNDSPQPQVSLIFGFRNTNRALSLSSTQSISLPTTLISARPSTSTRTPS
jgi:hypothetical protein